MDKSLEYAKHAFDEILWLRERLNHPEQIFIEQQFAKAYRAGEANGIADANRKVEIHEPPMAFSRGLGT